MGHLTTKDAYKNLEDRNLAHIKEILKLLRDICLKYLSGVFDETSQETF